MAKSFIVKVTDKEGKDWVYGGSVMGNPIFVEVDKGHAMSLSYNEAHDVWMKNRLDGETYLLEERN